MRLFLISLLATLLLAAGCASNHAKAPSVAPSQQANQSSSGWSVPPGQQHAPSASAAAKSSQQAQQEAQRQQAAARAEAQAAQQQAAEKPPVKPIVPAVPVHLQQTQVPQLRMVHFGFDDWNLSPQARGILNANAAWLNANPRVDVQIGGHCDERGSPEYNMALGERRANRVRNFLIRHGVAAERLTAVSFGEEVPLDPAHNEAAWAKNRRAEFHRIPSRQASRSTARPPSS